VEKGWREISDPDGCDRFCDASGIVATRGDIGEMALARPAVGFGSSILLASGLNFARRSSFM
jgi:hypothetical protein